MNFVQAVDAANQGGKGMKKPSNLKRLWRRERCGCWVSQDDEGRKKMVKQIVGYPSQDDCERFICPHCGHSIPQESTVTPRWTGLCVIPFWGITYGKVKFACPYCSRGIIADVDYKLGSFPGNSPLPKGGCTLTVSLLRNQTQKKGLDPVIEPPEDEIEPGGDVDGGGRRWRTIGERIYDTLWPNPFNIWRGF